MPRPKKKPDESKVQRSIGLPGSYWKEIDDIAWERREKPAVLAAQLLLGALAEIRAGRKKGPGAPANQPSLFGPPAGAPPAKKAAKKAPRKPRKGQ